MNGRPEQNEWMKWKREVSLRCSSLPLCPLFCILTLLSLYGCAEEMPREGAQEPAATEGEPEFTPPTFTGGRKLDTLFTVDLDDDGRREYVVTSMEEMSGIPSASRSDMVSIYRLDTAARRWVEVVADTALWSVSWRLMEMTGDRAPELVGDIEAGGNDPVASNGMVVYSGSGGTIRKLWEGTEGDPRIERNGADLPYIVVSRTYWPVPLPHVQAIPYVSQIISLKGGTIQNDRERLATYARGRQEELKRAYQNLAGVSTGAGPDSTDDDGVWDEAAEGSDLYVVVAEMLLMMDEAGMKREMRDFWHAEEGGLEGRMDEELFGLLSDLYNERIMK